MKRNIYTLIYAIVLGGVCSLVPTFIAEFTAPYRLANAKAEEIRNVLHVLGVPFAPKMTSKELVGLFEQKVRVRKGDALQRYESCDSLDTTRVMAVAVACTGPGIWGLIKGFIAFEPDMTTIRRVSFYQNDETPGLGGEIGTEAFQSRFIGKKIRDASGKAGFRIKRTGANGPNEIDGISGATLTCGKVEAILNNAIRQIDKEAISVK